MSGQVEIIDAIWRAADRLKAAGRPVPKYWLAKDTAAWWRKNGAPLDACLASGEAYVLTPADFEDVPVQPDLFGAPS